MPIIQTALSKITNPDGTLASGRILIQPNSEFEYTDPLTGIRKKVTKDSIIIPIVSGVITSFFLAPTTGALQDKINIFYQVAFLMQKCQWIENWILDVSQNEVEITNVALTQTVTLPAIYSYLMTSDHTKALHDDLGIDAGTLNGSTAAEIIAAGGGGGVPGGGIVGQYLGKHSNENYDVEWITNIDGGTFN